MPIFIAIYCFNLKKLNKNYIEDFTEVKKYLRIKKLVIFKKEELKICINELYSTIFSPPFRFLWVTPFAYASIKAHNLHNQNFHLFKMREKKLPTSRTYDKYCGDDVCG